jgi:hypothetical protein
MEPKLNLSTLAMAPLFALWATLPGDSSLAALLYRLAMLEWV